MVINMETQSSLEEAALKRKERLRALKRKKEHENNPEAPQNHSEIEELPKPKFRSYNPNADELAASKLPEPQLVNIEEEIKDQLESAKSKVVLEELDITTLAPRKPDWDLKRDVAKKLEKLERRTQKAIAELIRDRLKQRQEDLATVVSGAEMNPRE